MRRYIEVESLTDRAEELEKELADFLAVNAPELEDASLLQAANAGWGDDNVAEIESLRDTLKELKGQGGDHKWRGDWYPAQLIRADEFENAMDELLEDCGELPKNLPFYLTVTVDYGALKMDYSEIEIDGGTYYYR